jgi:hypothetical protein
MKIHPALAAALLVLMTVGVLCAVGNAATTRQEPNDSAAIRSILEDLRWMESVRFHREVWKAKTTADCDGEACLKRHRDELRKEAAEKK